MCDVCLIVRESIKFLVYQVRSFLLLAFGPTPIFFFDSVRCLRFICYTKYFRRCLGMIGCYCTATVLIITLFMVSMATVAIETVSF
jgi:hypothetical protein